MKKTFALVGSVAVTVAIFACKKEDDSAQVVAPNASASGTYAYPNGQQPPPGYAPTASAYPPGAQPVPGAYPTDPNAAVPGAAPAMATPNQLALPCSVGCGLARCNTQFQKCAFPCKTSAVDCIEGSMCMEATGFCVPKTGQ